MNKKQVVASLNKIANELDNNGLHQEANVVTNVMVKISQLTGQNETRPGNPSLPRNPQNKSIFDRYPVPAPGTAGTREKSIFEKYPAPTPGTKGTRDRSIFEKYPAPKPGTMGTDSRPEPPYDLVPDSPMDTVPDSPSTNNTPIGKPNPLGPGKPSQPSSKPGMPSKPGGSKPSAPKSADGLDRWVNKAENIYSAWALKNANPNSSAFGLIADIVDYMQRVKSKLPSNLQGSADAKINKVKQMKDSIPTGTPLTAYLLTTDYSEVSGVKGKGANPFTYDPSKRLTGKQLDYQADYESKRY